jgi:hypothetical protein
LKNEENIGLTKLENWKVFAIKTMRQIYLVSEVVSSISREKNVWGYGAAGRATMWVNACKMNYLGAMVDSSPLRVGKLMPGTHTPIVYPEALKMHPPDYIIVTAWNYFDIIRAKEWYKEYGSFQFQNRVLPE